MRRMPHMLPGEPDAGKWRKQLGHLSSAFLPGSSLSNMVHPSRRHRTNVGALERKHIVDACAELHHTVVDLFTRGMLGVKLLPETPEVSKEPCEAVAIEGFAHPEVEKVRQLAVEEIIKSSDSP